MKTEKIVKISTHSSSCIPPDLRTLFVGGIANKNKYSALLYRELSERICVRLQPALSWFDSNILVQRPLARL